MTAGANSAIENVNASAKTIEATLMSRMVIILVVRR